MSEEKDKHNQQHKPNKAVNVTKPKEQKKPTPSTSQIDTSRVSAHTMREQQALEKLKKQVGNLDQKENRASNIKTIIAIILVVILIILSVVFIIVIGRGSSTEESEVHDMRLSVQIENKPTLSIITETGQERLREINPGDKIPLRARVRNSSDIRGDLAPEDSTPPAIYVRFKLVLVLDYEERYDIMIPTLTEKWYKYDKAVEDTTLNGVFEDDHYYYYLGSLTFMETQELFSQIEFDGNVITCDDGGKYGQIQVHVDCIEANINYIVNRRLWPTAPQGWINKMVAGWTSDLEDTTSTPSTEPTT